MMNLTEVNFRTNVHGCREVKKYCSGTLQLLTEKNNSKSFYKIKETKPTTYNL